MPQAIPTHRSTAHAAIRQETARQHDRSPARREAHAFYCTARWKRYRRWFLARHPMCEAKGCDEPATEVHHREPVRKRPDLAFVEANCEANCRPCHSRETIKGARP